MEATKTRRSGSPPDRQHASNPPKSEQVVAAKIMVLATNLRRSGSLLYARALNLSTHEWPIIGSIGMSGATSLRELADRLGLDKGLASREVSSLVRRGLLLKERPSKEVRIRLSPAGEEMMQRVATLSAEREDFLLADMSEKERAVFIQQLEMIGARAKTLLEQVNAEPDED